jgi:CheY-like chemotaxis protein
LPAAVGLVTDLLDRSRIEGVARAVGSSVAFVSDLDELVDSKYSEAMTVFVDLTDKDLDGIRVPEVVGHRSGSQRPILIGFIAHNDKEGLAAAEAAGFDEVLTRAAFFKRLSVLLAQARDRDSTKGESKKGDASSG